MEISLALDNTPSSFEIARERLDELFRADGLAPDIAGELELIVEEILVNIIHYAYAVPGEGRVQVDAKIDPAAVTLVFCDEGAPFNPLDRPAPDLDAPVADRPVGGLGIFLTTELATSVTYERRDGSNVLTVVKLR